MIELKEHLDRVEGESPPRYPYGKRKRDLSREEYVISLVCFFAPTFHHSMCGRFGGSLKLFILYRLERKMAQTTNRIANIKRAIFGQKEDIVEMVGLPTSEIIDPRITVAWCRRHEVPIEKVSYVT